MKRVLSAVAAFSLLSVLLSAPAATAAPTSKAADNVTIYSGYGQGPTQAVVDEFFPKTIRVAEGTTVTWVQETPRDHSITFLAGGPLPLVRISQPEDRSAPQMRNPLAEYATLPDGPYDGSYFINSGTIQDGDHGPEVPAQ